MSDLVESRNADDSPIIDRDGHLDAGSLGRVVWITDVGHARSRNEDRLLVTEAFGGRFLLLVVADGAGGHNRGDKAANTVVTSLAQMFRDREEPPEGPPAAWLNDFILSSHAEVRALAKGENRPPASTLVGLLVERDTLCAWRFHVGDSRLYGRKAQGHCVPWTRDHNITNGLIDRGLPVAQAMKIAEGGKLTQVMGGGTEPEPEIRGPFQIEARWSFLLCSDGVYGYNDDRNVIGPTMDPDVDLADRAMTLKEAVLAGDAMDNLTAVLWDVPADAVPARQRLGLVEPYDPSDAGTMLGMPIHPTEGLDAGGPTGPPPPSSMPNIRSIEDVDLEHRQKLADEGDDDRGPSDDDLLRAQAELDQARRGSAGLAFGGLLIITLVILAAVVWFRRSDPTQTRMTVEEMEEERADALVRHGAVASEAPTPERRTADPVQDRLDQLVGRFDKIWWQGLPEGRRDQLLRELRALLGPRGAEPMRLSWEQGDPAVRSEAVLADWPAAGGANAELAAEAWAARGRILGLHGDLAAQSGVPEAMREAACDQVQLRWPRGNSKEPGDALDLGTWLAACLPAGADGASLSVRLGAWPDVGWSQEDLNQVGIVAKDPEGPRSVLQFDFNWNPRLVELGQLAVALTRPAIADVQMELKFVLPSSDAAQDHAVIAKGHAVAIASLIGGATNGTAEIEPVGATDEPLVPVLDRAALTPGQRAKVDGLDRRLELTLFRASPLDPDEEDEEELPDAPAEPPSP